MDFYKIDLLYQYGEALDLDKDVMLFFREIVGNYLSQFGFDENYNANSDGIILENLIDKLI